MERGTGLGQAVKGEEEPDRCGCAPANKHRRGARGMVRNTIKHGGTRKVAVTTQTTVRACARPVAADFLLNRDICFRHFVHLTGVATQEEIYL